MGAVDSDDHGAAGAHDASQSVQMSAGGEEDCDDNEIEVERLYERLKQSVHLREGFRLYHKLCMEEHATRVRTVAVAADVDATSRLGQQATSPLSPGAEEVRKANAERFAARMRRKRAQLLRLAGTPTTCTFTVLTYHCTNAWQWTEERSKSVDQSPRIVKVRPRGRRAPRPAQPT
jgi:hypothetical protein